MRIVCREIQNTRIFDNNYFFFFFFFFKIAIYEIMWKKCGIAGRATDDNMVHAHCMLDN